MVGEEMYYSKVLGKTLRETPHGVTCKSHGLLLRGGYVRQLSQGLFSFLPMGVRVLDKIKRIIREEMEALGGQEVIVPLINPAEIWKKSGRYNWIHREMIRFRDRHGHELVISPTHEEAMIELVKRSLSSYKELPLLLYEFQAKFRDEERPRGGLLRSKEFIMKDGYSFHRSFYELNNFFPKMFAAYSNIFRACRVPVVSAEAGVGFIGGEKAYEFLMPSDIGDDVVIKCTSCAYLANRNIARGGKVYIEEEPKELKKIYTPGCKTMESLAEFLKVPRSRLAKSVVYSTGVGLVMAVVRGDYEISEEKLSRVIGSSVLGLADDNELRQRGFSPGYLSPIGLGGDGEIRIIVDELVKGSANLVYGANEHDHHYLNGNWGRDYMTDEVYDISITREEDQCLQCGGTLKEFRAVELGHIFKLGNAYSRALNLVYQNENGKKEYPYMGCYGIGLGRLIFSIVEYNSDERGIVWPVNVAPFRVYLMSIGKSRSVRQVTKELYETLGEETIFDDREESPGVKFKDSEILGIPFRVVVSSRNIEKGIVEVTSRRTGEVRYMEYEPIERFVENFGEFVDEVKEIEKDI